ncbi:LPXTG cell wall anchor domain-containing protein [Streptomyces sp. S.PB5]|uniref:LPXTG cell wall anchor domain-containing protein n=1 Tax=Streptomyces sp. S.PB5 TaxID=3020844 RepID=UPI0025B0D324|nr:LPXTG cell wall anchor domain-containing protein [Streptomyces sp. S.PB5]MDN3029554.1 LPXTG cell wall anchor domain-containing protein [Streptomyces sp. S.PB5]
MSSARRPLLTATAAGTLLGALWFVPSANATQDEPARTEVTQQARAATTESSQAAEGTRLADTGSFDTTPYVVGGTAFLGLGAGFVIYSVRRERLDF